MTCSYRKANACAKRCNLAFGLENYSLRWRDEWIHVWIWGILSDKQKILTNISTKLSVKHCENRGSGEEGRGGEKRGYTGLFWTLNNRKKSQNKDVLNYYCVVKIRPLVFQRFSMGPPGKGVNFNINVNVTSQQGASKGEHLTLVWSEKQLQSWLSHELTHVDLWMEETSNERSTYINHA